MTNLKRIIVLLTFLALGVLVSTSVAQDGEQIFKMEQTIAQLQAELAALKANQQPAFNQATNYGLAPAYQPETLSSVPEMIIEEPINEDVQHSVLLPEVADEVPAINSQPNMLPDYIPPSLNSVVVEPPFSGPIVAAPVIRAPIVESPILHAPIVQQPRVLVRQTVVTSDRGYYCPVTGRTYRTPSDFYYRPINSTRVTYSRTYNSREWDYFDEDRASRNRHYRSSRYRH